ncbi:RagB/SusD family nutrient uptake outer membrane protein [Flavicella sediminum]|uniref:RagB/SusD family nutrient uptake outer membrane protein n=1 Tax=Flavicella sediminum TaxID=2585141 RepID=UPI001122D947|nr:RagB/SusD family nutrient uptake outer membrane protein [Flavicella sediminum]
MKNIKIKVVIAILMATVITSCEDSFLEQTSPNFLSTGIFWETIEDFDNGLTATYKAFSKTDNIRLIENLHRSDLAWGNGWQRPTTANIFYLQLFNNANDAGNRQWTQNYTTIFRANQVIVNLNKKIGTFENETEETIAAFTLAQARFIRGYMYFLLYNTFNQGSVPIFDYVAETEEDHFQSLRPASEVKAFYMADLEYAAKNLPVEWADDQKGRVTAGAAVSLIGQTHLYAGDFAQAALHFKNVIDNFGYALTPHFGSNITTKDELNEESILEVVYSMDHKQNLAQYDSRDVSNASYIKHFTGVQGWFGAGPASWLINTYKQDPLDYSDPENFVEEVIYETYKREVVKETITRPRVYSIRTSYSLALVDDNDLGYYPDPATPWANPGQTAPFNQSFAAYFRKHTNWDLGAKSEDELSPGKVRSGVNERLIRLAEIYLQYAECQIELGNLDEALLYINKVRRRAKVALLGEDGSGEFPNNDHMRAPGNTPWTLDNLREHLRHVEYPLELSAEGDGNRNIDLRRWGVKKQRFQELAQKRYAADHYVTTNPKTGASITKWSTLLYEVQAGDPNIRENFNDLELAAKNYNDDLHAYLPIPNSEIIANPRLYDTAE